MLENATQLIQKRYLVWVPEPEITEVTSRSSEARASRHSRKTESEVIAEQPLLFGELPRRSAFGSLHWRGNP